MRSVVTSLGFFWTFRRSIVACEIFFLRLFLFTISISLSKDQEITLTEIFRCVKRGMLAP
jgi:hypothetical protein